MKKFAVVFFATCFAVSSVKAGQYVSGIDFEVSHATTISAVGVYDGGVGFTGTETVGVFSELTGDLVGSEAVFGSGAKGTQVGQMFYESIPSFVLSPGDYTIISVSTGVSSSFGGGSHLFGGNSDQNLGADVDLPGGGRFNSGTSFDISLNEDSGFGDQAGFIDLVDPAIVGAVPDGGMTAVLLGAALAGLGWARRRF